jgi:hypothetical protein
LITPPSDEDAAVLNADDAAWVQPYCDDCGDGTVGSVGHQREEGRENMVIPG